MEHNKFKDRALKGIQQSLYIQGLDGKMTVTELTEFRDRYFLVNYTREGNQRKGLFLRYDRWYFFIPGITAIPEVDRREYHAKVRGKGNDPKALAEKQREEINKRIEMANKILERTKKIVRSRG